MTVTIKLAIAATTKPITTTFFRPNLREKYTLVLAKLLFILSAFRRFLGKFLRQLATIVGKRTNYLSKKQTESTIYLETNCWSRNRIPWSYTLHFNRLHGRRFHLYLVVFSSHVLQSVCLLQCYIAYHLTLYFTLYIVDYTSLHYLELTPKKLNKLMNKK